MRNDLMRPDYILKLIENDERIDGRKLDEFRKINIETGCIKRAEGSARVKLGKTDVIVGIKTEIGKPFSDMPNMGILKTGAEFTPIASPDFESGPPNENAIELARVVDRGVRESESIDLEKLCLKEGEKVWEVFVDVHIINHDGNLIDAAALAAVAALKMTKIPKIEDDKIIREKLEKKLPLSHETITVTVGKLSNKFIIDPIKEEEEVLNSKLSVAVREDVKICAMQKSGNESISFDDLDKMIDLAVKKTKELRKLL
jgi:exosome complex component RRP42